MYHVVTMRMRDRTTYKHAYRLRAEALEKARQARLRHDAVCTIATMRVLPGDFPLGGGLARSI
jgi:hypothetical protein